MTDQTDFLYQGGNVTVMPRDLVVGDREGVYFIPPQFVKETAERSQVARGIRRVSEEAPR